MKHRIVIWTLLFGLGVQAQAAARGRGEVGSRVQTPRISSLSNTSCIVLDDGTVRCWGANEHGQIGNGRAITKEPVPVQPTGIGGVIAVTAGVDHTCALLAAGTVKCWGDNSYGQLGTGTSGGMSSTAVSVKSLDLVVAIAAGEDYTCALRVDGTARCWGYNAHGSLGNGTFDSSATPVSVNQVSDAVAITAGAGHACALRVNGTLRCWGLNDNGQLGNGSNLTPKQSVVVSTSSGLVLSGVVKVTAGAYHTCAIGGNGAGACWGHNDSGQLGDGTAVDKNLPAPVNQLNQAIDIAAGWQHSCALRSDGGIRCWGRNGGRLGDGSVIGRSNAGTAVVGFNNAVAIAAGFQHTCALDAGGKARCWGSDSSLGQLGNGGSDPSLIPLRVTGIAGTVGARGIVAGEAFTCARRGIGAVACWGRDDQGEHGNGGGFLNSSNPVPVSELTEAVALAAGSHHACALRSLGTVVCWGNNSVGQLGNGNNSNQSAPVAVAGLSGVVAVAAGFHHTCALLDDGTARCWGGNLKGELGNNTMNNSLTPVIVSELDNAVAIVAGGGHTCALLVGGTVRCWGSNPFGELGNGSNNDSPIPVTVTGLTNVVALAAGGGHTCAVLSRGGGRCWGDNRRGQLGNTLTESRNIPDDVSGLSDAVSVTAGALHTCAVRAAGDADCWGRNFNGQLAAADSADHSTPTSVIATFATVQGITVPFRLSSIVAMAAGAGNDLHAHTCSLQVSGLPRCWGSNSAGQIGENTTIDAVRPTSVPSFSANVALSVILKSNGRIAEVTALLNCEVGSHGQIFVSLAQGAVVGYGVTSTNCDYGLLEVPLVLAANGPKGFQPGAATARLEAIVREKGTITEHLFWTRSVTLAAP